MTSLLEFAETYGNSHKILLQLVMERGGLRTTKIVDVFNHIARICSPDTEFSEEGCSNVELYEVLLSAVNEVLQPLNLALGLSPNFAMIGEILIVLHSTTSFAESHVALWPNHCQTLFQAWLRIMFGNANENLRGELDDTDALNACRADKITPVQAQAFLTRLEKENILQKLRNFSSYVFTPRAALELEPRLRDDYDIPECSVCSHLVILRRFATVCSECGAIIHNTCLKKMMSLSSTDIACPGIRGERCSNQFDEDTINSFEFDTPAPEKNKEQSILVGNRGEEDEETDEETSDVEEQQVDDNEDEADELEPASEEVERPASSNSLLLSPDESSRNNADDNDEETNSSTNEEEQNVIEHMDTNAETETQRPAPSKNAKKSAPASTSSSSSEAAENPETSEDFPAETDVSTNVEQPVSEENDITEEEPSEDVEMKSSASENSISVDSEDNNNTDDQGINSVAENEGINVQQPVNPAVYVIENSSSYNDDDQAGIDAYYGMAGSSRTSSRIPQNAVEGNAPGTHEDATSEPRLATGDALDELLQECDRMQWN